LYSEKFIILPELSAESEH